MAAAAGQLHCSRYLVSGRVQGVGFRWFVSRTATRLGIRGHVRNLPGGQVEVVAVGPQAVLEVLEEKLADGPPAAQVTGVDKYEIPSELHRHKAFVIK